MTADREQYLAEMNPIVRNSIVVSNDESPDWYAAVKALCAIYRDNGDERIRAFEDLKLVKALVEEGRGELDRMPMPIGSTMLVFAPQGPNDTDRQEVAAAVERLGRAAILFTANISSQYDLGMSGMAGSMADQIGVIVPTDR